LQKIFFAKWWLKNSPQTPLFAMSRAHLKRGAFSTGEKTPCESPNVFILLPAIFDFSSKNQKHQSSLKIFDF
jgi:hypothetical protein